MRCYTEPDWWDLKSLKWGYTMNTPIFSPTTPMFTHVGLVLTHTTSHSNNNTYPNTTATFRNKTSQPPQPPSSFPPQSFMGFTYINPPNIFLNTSFYYIPTPENIPHRLFLNILNKPHLEVQNWTLLCLMVLTHWNGCFKQNIFLIFINCPLKIIYH